MAKAHLFSDNFNDNTRDTVKWICFGQIQEVNQRVEIRPLPGRSGASFSGYSSKVTHDLTDSSIEVEVVQVLGQMNGTSTLLSAGPDDDNRVMIAVKSGQITCIQVVGSVVTSPSRAPCWPARTAPPWCPTRARTRRS